MPDYKKMHHPVRFVGCVTERQGFGRAEKRRRERGLGICQYVMADEGFVTT